MIRCCATSRSGFPTIHGGTWLNSIVTLNGPAPLETAARSLARVGSEEAAWLAQYSENNRMPGVGELLSTEAVMRYRARAREQRTRAGRIKAAILVYAYALESDHPDRATERGAPRADFGEMANLWATRPHSTSGAKPITGSSKPTSPSGRARSVVSIRRCCPPPKWTRSTTRCSTTTSARSRRPPRHRRNRLWRSCTPHHHRLPAELASRDSQTNPTRMQWLRTYYGVTIHYK